METYGLTENDLLYSQKKVDTQRKYLEENTFSTSTGQTKTLLDVSFSANHSTRYYAQLTNKINSMENYAKLWDFVPLFLTITLDGFYRDIYHRKNFQRSDMLNQKQLSKIPNNDKYGYVRDSVVNHQSLTIKDMYNVLNYQLQLFRSSYAFKLMKKEGVRPIYIRTVEPHKDGIPHFHIMYFVPNRFVEQLKKDYIKAFPASQNSKVINESGELAGFLWNIGKPAAYILKYITKSFMDLKNGNELDYLQAWYIKHKIPRSVTSHTLIPQWVYQKMYPLESDWLYLKDLHSEWSKEDDYILFHDEATGRKLEFDKGVYRVSYGDRVIKEFGQKKEVFTVDRYEKIPLTWVDTKHKERICYVNGKRMIYRSIKPGVMSWLNKKPLDTMGNIQLYNYYHSLDVITTNQSHFDHVENMLVERGLLAI